MYSPNERRDHDVSAHGNASPTLPDGLTSLLHPLLKSFHHPGSFKTKISNNNTILTSDHRYSRHPQQSGTRSQTGDRRPGGQPQKPGHLAVQDHPVRHQRERHLRAVPRVQPVRPRRHDDLLHQPHLENKEHQQY